MLYSTNDWIDFVCVNIRSLGNPLPSIMVRQMYTNILLQWMYRFTWIVKGSTLIVYLVLVFIWIFSLCLRYKHGNSRLSYLSDVVIKGKIPLIHKYSRVINYVLILLIYETTPYEKHEIFSGWYGLVQTYLPILFTAI